MSILDINKVKQLFKTIQTFERTYNRKNNAFDFLRFILATMVIYSHSYPLLYGSSNRGDYLARWTNNQVSFGALAVYGFFIISGFLITQSLLNSNSYKIYLFKRLVRILPAFFASLFVIAFVLGPLLTETDVRTFFRDINSENSPLKFLLKNFTFNIFGYSWTVKDLFMKNPFPNSANGSMWSLKHEFAMYLVMPVLSFFLFLRFRLLMLISTILLSCLVFFNIKYGFMLFHLPANKYWVLGSNEYNSFIKLAYYFFVGVLIYLYQDKLYFNIRFILLAFFTLLVGNFLGGLNYVLLISLPYIIISTGIGCKFSSFSKYGDFSYGLYIYAFPVQQTLIYLYRDKLNLLTLFGYSFILTFGFAILSWRYIEKPAINLKSLIQKQNFSKDLNM